MKFTEEDKIHNEDEMEEMKDGTKVLVCACPSTAKIFAMRVLNTLETCEASQKWLHGEKKMNIIESC